MRVSELLDHLGERQVSGRTTFTPLAQCSLALWLGSAIVLTVLRNAGSTTCLAIFVLSIILALLFVRHPLPQSLSPIEGCLRLVLAFSLLGASLASLSAYALIGQSSRLQALERPLVFQLEEDLVPRNGEYRVLAFIEVPRDGKRYLELSFNEDPGLLLTGDSIRSSTVLLEDDLRSTHNWDKRICAQATAYSYEFIERKGLPGLIDQARRKAIESFETRGGAQAGILQALICGYRGGIETTGEYKDYKIVGLAHVIAVSGSHLAIVAAFVQALLLRLNVHVRYRCLVTVLIMAGYFVFTGSSISAFRSLIMVVVAVCAYYSSRRNSALNALSLCIIFFITLDPYSSLSVSFALSAFSTLGIIVFASLFIGTISTSRKSIDAVFVDPVALTCASALTTQAYSAALFSQLPLASLLANVLIAPLFLLSCVLGLLAALVSVLAPGISQVFVSMASVSCAPMQFITNKLACLPYASIPFDGEPACMIALSALWSYALYLWWPDAKSLRRATLMLIACLALLAGLRAAYIGSQDEIIMLDVGQGDSFVVRSEGASIMIDTGTNDAMLKQALARNGVFHLEGLVITHADDDHCGSLQMLAQVVQIDSIYLHEDLLECPCDNCSQLLESISSLKSCPEIVPLNQGDLIEFGNFRCRVVWPYAYEDQGGNSDSLCLLIEHLRYGWTSLMVGDAEQAELGQMLKAGDIGRVDVLKVGHHGSAQSVSSDLIELMQPLICLISVGANNSYGHPDGEVLAALESEGVMVLRSDQLGDVSLRFKEEQIKLLY